MKIPGYPEQRIHSLTKGCWERGASYEAVPETVSIKDVVKHLRFDEFEILLADWEKLIVPC